MSEFKLTINKKFSEKFNRAKEKEEREALLAKYGNVNENSLSSSSSESEDDDGKDITEGTDRTIYRILSALQSKDSRCYDPNYKFFSDKSDEESDGEKEEDKAKQTTKKKKDNPMFLKDYEREVIVQCKGKLDDMSETSEEDEIKETACYYEQQKEFQMSFMKAGAGNEEEDDDESEGLVNIKVSSLDEKKKREEDGYVEWLKGQKNVIDESLAKDLEPLRNFYNDPNLDENEKFLRDYFLNKRYKDGDESELDEEEVLKEVEADEKEFDAEELFVAKVNHRFEEPDKEFIKSYPRTIGDSLRNKDVKRAEKRKQVKERKLAEKQKEKEELKRLKNLKKKEVQEKLKKLKMIMGNDSVDLTEQDLEEDFDPDKHDAVMEKLIGEDYYDQDDDDDDEKPVFDLDDFDDIEETWEDEDSEEMNDNEDDSKPFCKQPQPGHSRDHASASTEDDRIEKPKNKKKTKFTEELEKLKQTLDSNEMSQEQYINEILSRMDYEDKVGDVTFRFGYRNVTPCDYGLTVAEVLKAPERELNSWVSVKKMSQYRTEEEEKWDVKLYKKKSNDLRKKLNILPSLGSDKSVALNETAAASSSAGTAPKDNDQTSSKKQRRKKRKQTLEDDTYPQDIQQNVTSSDTGIKEIKSQKAKKLKTDDGIALTNRKKNSETEIPRAENSETESREEKGEKKKGKKRKKKHGSSVPTMSSDRLEAYGINEKKFKYVIQNKLHQEMKKKQKKQKS